MGKHDETMGKNTFWRYYTDSGMAGGSTIWNMECLCSASSSKSGTGVVDHDTKWNVMATCFCQFQKSTGGIFYCFCLGVSGRNFSL